MSELGKSNSSLPIFLMGGKTTKYQAYSGLRCTPLEEIYAQEKRGKKGVKKNE